MHNDVSDVPNDAIDTGFGWGYQDVGGNPNYHVRLHGYDRTGNLEYQVPTVLRNTLVAYNRIHDVKKLFEDGGAYYNLSANPSSELRENYFYDLHGRIAIYLDEGTRFYRVVKNVVDGTGQWLNNNTIKAANPMRITIDNQGDRQLAQQQRDQRTEDCRAEQLHPRQPAGRSARRDGGGGDRTGQGTVGPVIAGDSTAHRRSGVALRRLMAYCDTCADDRRPHR